MTRLLLVSPVGPLLVEHDGAAVRSIRFWRQGEHPPAGTRDEPARDDALGRRVAEQLRDYFAGTRSEFDLPLHAEGTDFQRRVWDALRAIPFGQTRTYGDVAAQLGLRPRGARAVGQANARNPLPIVVPCHRVLGAGNALGGYMGSGPDGEGAALKRWLLRHEGAAGW
ncbi:MAG TPA: methylated-DNA--[protein]-cysteine S-methyltransferase [Longimicrobiaceae bacterium]|nr:methylated-DNA--[protein]-cysteine S-methyltransferase [Longimicrobiaceae bacterium]